MSTLQAVFIFIGLSLDAFIVFMETGATIRGLTFGKMSMFSAIYTLINALYLLAGYGISTFFKWQIYSGKIEIAIACLIVLAVGIYQVTKSYKGGEFEEKLDKDFNVKKFRNISFWTSIDTFFVGAGFFFMGMPVSQIILICCIISFITVFVAMSIGYMFGAKYQSAVGMSGGALMVIFSLYFFAVYVLR